MCSIEPRATGSRVSSTAGLKKKGKAEPGGAKWGPGKQNFLIEREEMGLLVKWRKSDTSCKCIVISYTSSQCIEIQYILRNRITSDISSKCVETCKKNDQH